MQLQDARTSRDNVYPQSSAWGGSDVDCKLERLLSEVMN